MRESNKRLLNLAAEQFTFSSIVAPPHLRNIVMIRIEVLHCSRNAWISCADVVPWRKLGWAAMPPKSTGCQYSVAFVGPCDIRWFFAFATSTNSLHLLASRLSYIPKVSSIVPSARVYSASRKGDKFSANHFFCVGRSNHAHF